MKSPGIGTLVVVLWALGRGIAVAQSAGAYLDPRDGLSVSAAIERALAAEPGLQAARAEIGVAQGAQQQAGLRPNPWITFERREQVNGTDNQTFAQFEWPLDLFRRDARVNVAVREREAIERSVDDRARLLAADVRSRYGDAAAAVRAVIVAAGQTEALRQQVELARGRVDTGAAPPLERDILLVESRRLEATRLLAVGRAEAAMVELRRIIGLPPDAPLTLKQPLEDLVASATAESRMGGATDSLTESRTDVQEAHAQEAVAEARAGKARANGRFEVSLFGSYMRMDQSFPQLGVNRAGRLEPIADVFHYASVGAMVTLPLRNRNQGDVAAAEAGRTAARARTEAVRLTAQSEIAAAASQWARSHEALSAIAEGLALEKQNLEIVRQTHALGAATISEVLTEQRRYLDMEQVYTDTLKSVYDTDAALRRARGER